MRFWLSEDERRPDPEPVRTDARKAVLAGTACWLVALAAVVVWREPLDEAGLGWLLQAAIVGVALGVIALVVVQLRRRRAR
ncbi:hypothetical protein ARHIZOSPH14_24030 [Agromyces rhizosphaerae]|uniref:DUF2530 domain-containing protein n=1 Tax=Agromyces rhizosphaerae TaxID=88374 RepID=A0A9W6CY53_9MICO|nr:DUF2530 domain-containing protein [Agromyces rhizosphaerae]GLI28161.1 hypothetical protein ARHIZOSPH14_24030 [Agromyces rhizosphaerae]